MKMRDDICDTRFFSRLNDAISDEMDESDPSPPEDVIDALLIQAAIGCVVDPNKECDFMERAKAVLEFVQECEKDRKLCPDCGQIHGAYSHRSRAN